MKITMSRYFTENRIARNSQRTLLAFFVMLIVGSFIFLGWKESLEQSAVRQKNWWSVSFVDPRSEVDMRFLIENNSDNIEFHYTLLLDGKDIGSDTVQISKGDKRLIDPQGRATNQKYRIEIRSEDQRKTLEKK